LNRVTHLNFLFVPNACKRFIRPDSSSTKMASSGKCCDSVLPRVATSVVPGPAPRGSSNLSFSLSTVTTVCGTNKEGYRDGPGADARLSNPMGVAVSADGSQVWVSDTGNQCIRLYDVKAGSFDPPYFLQLSRAHSLLVLQMR
jgi:hypothetical protein